LFQKTTFVFLRLHYSVNEMKKRLMVAAPTSSKIVTARPTVNAKRFPY